MWSQLGKENIFADFIEFVGYMSLNARFMDGTPLARMLSQLGKENIFADFIEFVDYVILILFSAPFSIPFLLGDSV